MTRFWAEKRLLSSALVITIAISNLYITPAQATLGVISSSDAIGVYMDQPYVQGSYVANNYPSMTLTDTYSATTSGDPCPTTGNVGTYSYAATKCAIIKRIHNAGNYIYGGALTTSGDTTTGTSAGITAESQSDSSAIYDAAGTTITFAEDKNYVGLWWSAGSLGNRIKLYQNSALILTLSVNDVCERVRGSGDCDKPTDNSTLTAIDSTTTYAKSNFFGHPYSTSTMASGEPFIYIHVFTQNSIKFNKINISTTGNGFEFDNLTVGNLSGAALTPRSSLVPVASYGSTYSLAYNSQGGTSVDTQTLVASGQVSITSTTPTRSGYIFSSWNTIADGSGTTYASSATYPAAGTISSNATLYAQWTAFNPCSTTTTTTDTTTLVAFKSTTICSYTFPVGLRTATALLVGGGGGGGGDTAGGGGGGAVETQTITANSDTWTVRVGAGGAGGSGASIGTTGGTTSFTTGATSYSAVGGSGGRNCNYYSGICNDGLGGAGGTNSRSVSSGSGGTGGYNGALLTAPTGGANGISNSITGTAVSYGAGGGGGQGGNCAVGSTAGGTYGGGTGYICSPDTDATAGQDWFGGGGGGGGTNGARGGNGVIYIQYVTPIPYTITSSADVNGTISASGTTTVYSGNSQSYTFSPVSGYKISDVLVNGTSQGAITSYTFSNVAANHTIRVVFEKITTTTTPTYVPEKSAEQIAAEAAAQKIADEKAAELLAAQKKALTDTAEADKAFKTLQEQLTILLNTGVFPKLPSTKNPSPTSNTSKSSTSTKSETSKSNVSVPEGTVLITPTQIASLEIAKSSSGNSANIAISQLKSGQRVKVTVISKVDLTSNSIDLGSTQIAEVTPNPSNAASAKSPTAIAIKPAPKTSASTTNQAQVSVTGAKKNQRVRVTVKSK